MLVIAADESQQSVWELTLVPPLRWIKLPSVGPRPAARGFFPTAYDPATDRVYIFAGSGRDGAEYNDLWSFSAADTIRWAQTDSSAADRPSRRIDPAMAFDATNNRIVIFGGSTSWPHPIQDMWEFNVGGNANWRKLNPAVIPDRNEVASALDETGIDWFIQGGSDGNNLHAELWKYDLATDQGWITQDSGGSPGPRNSSPLAFDPDKGRAYLFGGTAGGRTQWFSDFWTLQLAGGPVWTRLDSTATSPPARAAHTLTFDPDYSSVILFGGRDSSQALGDLWQFDTRGQGTWTELHPVGPSPSARLGHSATYDPIHKEVIVIGGSVDNLISHPWFDDVWALSLEGQPRWRKLVSENNPFGWGVEFQVAVYDSRRDRIVVFGGNDDFMGSVVSRRVVSMTRVSPDTVRWNIIHVQGLDGRLRAYIGDYDAVNDRILFLGFADSNSQGQGPFYEIEFADSLPRLVKIPFGSPNPGAVLTGQSGFLDAQSQYFYEFGGRGINGSSASLWAADVEPDAGPSHLAPLEAPDLVAALNAKPRLELRSPNPTSSGAELRFEGEVNRLVSVSVHDIRGRLVKQLWNGIPAPGSHEIYWNGTDESGQRVPPGIYFCLLNTGGKQVETRLVQLDK
jgi:hypothetical protein